MKTLATKYFCLQFKLYKIGLIIGVIYIILNMLMIWSIISAGADNYAVVLLCSLTIMTSIILIYGLIQNLHTLLLPWLSNIDVLIIFNIFAVIAEFEEANRLLSRASFYLAFGFFMALEQIAFLEIQVLFWYTIFTLLRFGHRKTFRVVEFVPENPTTKQFEDKDTFKMYLVGTDGLNGTQRT